MSTTTQQRVRDLKKGLTSEDGRRRREQHSIQLRKNKRQESVLKRRNMARTSTPVVNDPSPVQPSPTAPSTAILSEYVKQALSETRDTQLAGVREIRRMLSVEHAPPVREVLASNILPRLVQLLDADDSPKLQFEAAWAITNIASTEYTRTIVEHDALRPLVRLLKESTDVDVREQCIWCLGNVAGDSAELRRRLWSEPNAVEYILLNIQHPANASLLQNAAWTISNLCRGKKDTPQELIKCIAPTLTQLLKCDDSSVLTDACWALSYATDAAIENIQIIVDAGAVPSLVKLLRNSEGTVTPALRALGNIATGNDVQTQTTVDSGILPELAHLVAEGGRNIRREACWTISNIAAGTAQQISAVVTCPGLLPVVVHALEKGEYNVRKEAMWVANNIASSGSAFDIERLVEANTFEALVAACECDDTEMTMLGLQTIQEILAQGRKNSESSSGRDFLDQFEESGGMDMLQNLSESNNNDIYNLASEIAHEYFETEEDDDENCLPEVLSGNGPTKSFAFGMPEQQQSSNMFGPGTLQQSTTSFDFAGTSFA